MKVTNRIQDLWTTGTRQAISPAVGGPAEAAEGRAAWLAWIENQLAAHPTLTLAVGLAAGVTIGWLIKRR